MLIKMKNIEILDLFNAIKQVSDTEKYNKLFMYALVMNEEILKPIVVSILKCSKPSKDYEQYEIERNKIIRKYAEQDEHGNLVTDNNLIKIKKEYSEILSKELSELNKIHKDILEIRKLELDEYNKILNESVDVNIYVVSLTHFPDLNKIMMKALKYIVKIED